MLKDMGIYTNDFEIAYTVYANNYNNKNIFKSFLTNVQCRIVLTTESV